MRWFEHLADSIFTFISSLIVICFLPKIQVAVNNMILLFAIDEKYTEYLESIMSALFVGIIYFILRIIVTGLGSCCKKVHVNVEFLNKKNKCISEVRFKKIDNINFDSEFIRFKFILQAPALPLKVIKLLGARIRFSFNPNLICCELDNGLINRSTYDDICYEDGVHTHIDLFSLYESSADSVSNSMDFNIQPIQKTTAVIKMSIIPKRSEGRLKNIKYFLGWILLKCVVRIKQKQVVLIS